MLNFLSPYKLLIEVVLIGALILGIGIGIHLFLQHEQDIGYQKAVAEYTTKELNAQIAARAKEAFYQEQLQEANQHAQNREELIKTLSDANTIVANSLRDTLANIRNGVSTASIDALRQSTTTLTTILADCQGKYSAMAETADRHANDAKTLMEAWPKDQDQK
jgi:hypothetical protein